MGAPQRRDRPVGGAAAAPRRRRPPRPGRALFATARRDGFDRLTAEVLAENDRMLRLLREEADTVTLRREGSAFHVSLELGPTEG